MVKLPLPLNITLWHAAYGATEEWLICPECMGTKEVKLTLANGEEYMLDCRCCQSGYDPPLGRIRRHIYDFRPTPFVARRWGTDGDKFWFSESDPTSPCWTRTNEEDLFTDETLCRARCEAKNAELSQQQAEQGLRNLMSKRKDLAWSVHYWRSQLADRRRDVEMIEKRLRACQERKKVKS
jgi:hypothetical protein